MININNRRKLFLNNVNDSAQFEASCRSSEEVGKGDSLPVSASETLHFNLLHPRSDY